MIPARITGLLGSVCIEMVHSDLGLVRLKRRADFLRVAKSRRRFAAPGLVLQVAGRQTARPGLTRRQSGVDEGSETAVGIGFTASKKVGNAVARNRAKRRLRAVVAELMPGHAVGGRDYVLIGRKATLRRPYADLLADLKQALRRTNSLAVQCAEQVPS
jgi:ribonuclease P protein component